jgi:hypothetical protein
MVADRRPELETQAEFERQRDTQYLGQLAAEAEVEQQRHSDLLNLP